MSLSAYGTFLILTQTIGALFSVDQPLMEPEIAGLRAEPLPLPAAFLTGSAFRSPYFTPSTRAPHWKRWKVCAVCVHFPQKQPTLKIQRSGFHAHQKFGCYPREDHHSPNLSDDWNLYGLIHFPLTNHTVFLSKSFLGDLFLHLDISCCYTHQSRMKQHPHTPKTPSLQEFKGALHNQPQISLWIDGIAQ